MIKDVLVREVVKRFPDSRISNPPDPIVTIDSPWEGVEPICIWDEGVEATVAIGQLTHGHFNPYDDTLSQSEIDDAVTADVIEFLDELTSDHIVVWSSPNNVTGGWINLRHSKPDIKPEYSYFVWSGKYESS